MNRLRLTGAALFAYGAVMLALLATPWREWALEHSIAHVVGVTDRRVGNTVDGAVDPIMAVVGSVVVMKAGLWVGVFLPRVFNRNQESIRAALAADLDPQLR